MTNLMMALSEPHTGNFNSEFSPENLDLRAENERMRAQLLRLKNYVSELEDIADADPLVPVYNRRAFMRELARAQSVAERYDIPSSVIYLDLNGFKSVNDNHGHRTGDEILRKVGLAVQSCIRACDMVARLGGDEFGILLFKTDSEFAAAKAEAIGCRIVDVKAQTADGSVGVTASWGIAECKAGVLPGDILSKADAMMYEKKREIQASKT